MDSVLMYSIKDCSLNRFISPFCARSDAEAKAMVRDAIQPDSTIGKHPGSFELYALCRFSEVYGISFGEGNDSFIFPEDISVDHVFHVVPQFVCKVSDLFDGLN